MTTAGGEPMITYVDHATEDRTELSEATVANWAAKFANLLLFDAQAGGVVGLRTDGHWAAVPATIGAWRVGMSVCPLHDAPTAHSDPDLTVAFEHVAGPDDLAVGPGLGGRLTPSAVGLRSFVEDVLAEPDDVDAQDAEPNAVALRMAAPERTAGDADLSVLAAELRAMQGRRTLLLDRIDSCAGLLALAASLLHGGALLILRNPDSTRIPRLVETEKVDCVAATPQHDRTAAGLPVGTHLRLPAW